MKIQKRLSLILTILGKYFVQYEKDSDVIGSEENDNIEVQLYID